MRRLGSAFVGLAALAVYLTFCPPVSGTGDSSEFTLVLATNGVTHPTGYPLYTLLGHVFCVLAHGMGASWPFAANAWSAVGGAIAVAFLHALGTELIGDAPSLGTATRFLAALLPVVPFALQPVVMDGATTAEINVWNVAWACGAAYVLVRLLGTIAAAGEIPSPRLTRAAAFWGLVCGAGAAHHATSILLAGPFSAGLLAALAKRKLISLRLILVAVAAALLPISTYGIIAWRAWHPALVQWPSLGPSVESVLDHITGHAYRFFLGSFAPGPGNLLARAVYPFLFPGLALLLLGALRAKGWDRRLAWWTLLAASLPATVFAFRYGVPDPEPYFLPPIALGVAAAAPAAASLAGARFMNRALRLGACALAVLAVGALAVPWCREAAGVRREAIDYEALIRSMWASIPADTAIVFWRDDRVIRLREYQILRGEKPALYVETPDVLIDDRTRRAFYRRFGFDPLQGLTVPVILPSTPNADDLSARFTRRLVQNVNERTRVPVIQFDPGVPIVRQLYKPWERPSDRGG
jgi:hypothetical protein